MKLAACLLPMALILQGQQPPGDTCYVAGRVVNTANGEPIRRARLILRRSDNPVDGGGSAAYTTLSDDHGRFAMQGIAAGRYEFSAERAGFATTSYGAHRPGRAGITLSLDAGQQLARVLFRLDPHAVIAGRILDQDGDPVQGVQIRTERYSYTLGKRLLMPSGHASTDDLGEYRLFGLASGRYYLEATYRGLPLLTQTRSGSKAVEESFAPTYYPGTNDIGNATIIDLAAGAQLRGMDFILSKTRTVHVRGHINFPSGVSRQLVMINLIPRETLMWDGMRRSRMLDAQGNFDVSDVRPGSYTLTALTHEEKIPYSAYQQVDVNGAPVENVVLNLSAGSEISGQLRCEGRPPSNWTEIQVNLQDVGADRLRFIPMPLGEAREDGSFTLSNVGNDIFRVRLYGLPDGYYLKSVRIGDDELKESGIDTTRGAAAGPLLLTISDKAGQVEGAVLNARQEPTPGATVVLVPEPKKRERYDAFRQVTTDQYGRFTLKTIVPGEYKLFAWEDLETGEYMDPEVLKPVEARGQPVSIHEGSRESAELKLIPAKPAAK